MKADLQHHVDARKVVLVDSILEQAHGPRRNLRRSATASVAARRLPSVADGSADRQSLAQLVDVTGVDGAERCGRPAPHCLVVRP